MEAQILVIGALGNVGTEVARALQAAGVSLRAADRTAQPVRERFGGSIEAVALDFGKPKTFAPAFQGIERAFFLRPPQITNIRRDMLPALEAAKAAGVRHCVFLSLIGIEQNRSVPHYQVEQYLRASGMEYTFLRCSFFMQNLNTTHRAEIRDQDEIFIPVGKARTSFIDARDIGAVAAAALTQDGHENKAYDLTGAESLDYEQVADLFTQVLERKITYKNPSSLAYFSRQMRTHGPMFALVTTWLYANTRRGMADRVTNTVEHILGHEPIRMRQYIEDYRACWQA